MKDARMIGVGLMCKPPRLGQSKTRLAATIGPDAAALLAWAFLSDTAEILTRCASVTALLTNAYFRPADAQAEIAAIIGESWQMAFCDAGDLGTSMLEALADLLRLAPEGAMIIGSDLPTLPDAHILAAAEHLRAADDKTAVIGPSLDGGYYLIGIRSMAAAPLFDPMVWSTPQVLAETRQRAIQHGIRLVEIGPWYDIDTNDDLIRIDQDVRSPARATRAALARLGASVIGTSVSSGDTGHGI